jgi:hypothetical protein
MSFVNAGFQARFTNYMPQTQSPWGGWGYPPPPPPQNAFISGENGPYVGAGAYGSNASNNVVLLCADLATATIQYSDTPQNAVENALGFARDWQSLVDLNGDRKVSLSESGQAIPAVDINNDFYVDMAEEAAVTLLKDSNRDGIITPDEMLFWNNLSDSEVRDALTQIIQNEHLYDALADYNRRDMIGLAKAMLLYGDQNQDGVIDMETEGGRRNQAAQRMDNIVDLNQDGYQDLQELIAVHFAGDLNQDGWASREEKAMFDQALLQYPPDVMRDYIQSRA